MATRRRGGRQDAVCDAALLGRAAWSADEVRDDIQKYVVKYLGDSEGVLVVDDTGFVKKGAKSAAVQESGQKRGLEIKQSDC